MKGELKARWKSESPDFFKKVIHFGIALGAIGAGILTSPIALPAIVVTAGGYLVTVGSTAAVIAKFTKK